MKKTQLLSTTELMRQLDIKSYNTIQRLQDAGIIHPIVIGRNKKWNLEDCLNKLTHNNNQHETTS